MTQKTCFIAKGHFSEMIGQFSGKSVYEHYDIEVFFFLYLRYTFLTETIFATFDYTSHRKAKHGKVTVFKTPFYIIYRYTKGV